MIKGEKGKERANLVCADTGCGDKNCQLAGTTLEAREGVSGLRCPGCYIVFGRSRVFPASLHRPSIVQQSRSFSSAPEARISRSEMLYIPKAIKTPRTSAPFFQLPTHPSPAASPGGRVGYPKPSPPTSCQCNGGPRCVDHCRMLPMFRKENTTVTNPSHQDPPTLFKPLSAPRLSARP